MNSERPVILAVSSSEQQRETVAIMLDPGFEVITVASLEGSRGAPRRPLVIVLSPDSWDELLLEEARARWPQTPLVLVDPSEGVRRCHPDALVATWSDPFSLPLAVACAVREPETRLPPPEALRFLERAAAELRPALRRSQMMAQLADLASLPASRQATASLLREQLAALLERLVWVDAAAPSASAVRELDFAAALAAEIDAEATRFACRGLWPRWRHRDRFIVRGAPEWIGAAARCLRTFLLELGGAGDIVIESRSSALICHHDQLDAGCQTLALAVARRLLASTGAEMHLDPGQLRIVTPTS